jgi:hypothetical protein
MKILAPTPGFYTINIIPRSYEVDTIKMYMHAELENTIEEVTINNTTKNDYYLQVDFQYFNFVEGRFYTFHLENGGEVTYRDKIFATEQDPEDYSINDGRYVANETTNEFKTL